MAYTSHELIENLCTCTPLNSTLNPSSMPNLTTKCKRCTKDFLIIDQEQAFYKKKDLPMPDNCPECRQKERLLLWGNPNMRENLDFFLDGPIGSIEKRHPAPEVFSSPEEELRHMVNIFKKKGERYEIFFFEAKHPVL